MLISFDMTKIGAVKNEFIDLNQEMQQLDVCPQIFIFTQFDRFINLSFVDQFPLLGVVSDTLPKPNTL